MKLLKTAKKDFFEILPPMIFFFIAFVLILTTKRMILSEYQISWTGFGTAVVGGILVGKVVLMVDARRPLGSQPASMGGSRLASLLAFADVACRALFDVFRRSKQQTNVNPPVLRAVTSFGIVKRQGINSGL